NGPLQSYFEIGLNRREQLWDGQLYERDGTFVYGQFRPTGSLYFSLSADAGEQIDFANSRLGEQLRVAPSFDWNVNRHLLMRVQHTSLRLDTLDGNKIFDAQLSDVRLTWQFNIRSFLRFTAQRQRVERDVELFVDDADTQTLTMASQLLYSYKVNPQTVFFLGYSDNYVDDDGYDDLTRTGRTLFIKLGYAWAP
ncbi:MAG: hypothetical protein JXB36_16015, partial [Gammaproteobacteria bacterium]|nr:hypothetical protein [Gammaproteobacteria bacterium]